MTLKLDGDTLSAPHEGVGYGEGKYTLVDEERLLEEARLQIMSVLLNLTLDTYYEMQGADAQGNFFLPLQCLSLPTLSHPPARAHRKRDEN